MIGPIPFAGHVGKSLTCAGGDERLGERGTNAPSPICIQGSKIMPATCQPPSVTAQDRTYVCNVHAPHAVRRFIRWQLVAWNLGHLIETAELVSSELVTNAVQNALGDYVAVRLECSDNSVCVRVWDDNPEAPVVGSPEPGDEHGRGLVITDALAEHWGCCGVASGGKVVWARLREPM
jgi:anti-sigma regulatory factor (Ser/Thr protein kinase)